MKKTSNEDKRFARAQRIDARIRKLKRQQCDLVGHRWEAHVVSTSTAGTKGPLDITALQDKSAHCKHCSAFGVISVTIKVGA